MNHARKHQWFHLDLRMCMARTSKSIGIIAGSGPEAGLDLWAKVLEENRILLGEDFLGGLDASHTVIFSEPLLGLSMHLDEHKEQCWNILAQVASKISLECDVFSIACNTLHCFSNSLTELALPSRFLSIVEVAREVVKSTGVRRVGLLGSRSVANLRRGSPYAALAADVEVQTPQENMDSLISDIKRLGPASPGLRQRLTKIVERLDADLVLLACTELPLLGVRSQRKTLIDLNRVLAQALDCVSPTSM